MMKRKISIKAKSEKISELLQKYNIDNYTINLEVEESKDLYKDLSSTEGIIDWDFVEEKEEKILPTLTTPKKSSDLITEFEKSVKIDLPGKFSIDKALEAIKDYEITDTNQVATLIESIYNCSIENKHFSFGENFLRDCKKYYQEVACSSPSFNHMMIREVINLRYHGVDIQEILKDVFEKLNENWASLINGKIIGVNALVYQMFSTTTPKN